jgi:hypothetical protein
VERTGIVGNVEAPFAVSFGITGYHSSKGPDLHEAAVAVCRTADEIKRRHSDAGYIPFDRWLTATMSPDGRIRNFGEVELSDQGQWTELIAGVPEQYQRVTFSAGSRGHIRLQAPASGFFGSPVRSLEAVILSNEDHVDADARLLLAKLRETASTPGVLTGYVHVDSIADPYTEVVTSRSRLGDDDFQKDVHGYYWAVLLTERHIEVLGGTHRIKSQAPCAIVEEMSDGGRPAVLCVLTQSPQLLEEEGVLEWREFLQPLLRAGYPVADPSEVGQHASPLGRPVWLYEGPPVATRIHFILTRGDEPQTEDVVSLGWSGRLTPGNRFTCRLFTTRDQRRQDTEIAGEVAAVVRAWFTAGFLGRLFGVDGTFHYISDVDVDEEGLSTLSWQFDPGSCDVFASLQRLAAALSELGVVLGGGTFDRLVATVES